MIFFLMDLLYSVFTFFSVSVMKRSAVFVVLLALTIQAGAQTYSPYQFLRVNTSARAAALAEATVASIEDTTYNMLNPASGFFTPAGKFSATFIKHVADINGGMAGYTMESAKKAKLTFFASYMSLGSFEGRDAFGNATGRTLTAGALSMNAMYSQEIDSGFHAGVGVNLISAQYPDVQSTAIALSGGLLYHIPNSRWNMGLSILNVGTQLSKVGNNSEPLPTDVRLGATHRLRGLPLLFNFSFHHLAERNVALFDGFKNFSVGGEFYVGKVLQLRVGYNNTLRRASSFPVSSRLAGISMGVGIVTKKITLDYALTNMMSGIMVHRLSVQASVDSL
ncbi:MAG: hypothetical protein RL156_1151 [Bacteroidota bacterium]|jgi:hypothetical protein